MATSSAVVAGTNATATQYNDLRTDAITRYTIYAFEVKSSLVVGDEQGPSFLVKKAGTVTKIKHKLVAGTATIRVQKNTTDIDAGVSVTTTAADESSITSAALTENEVLTLDITATASGSGLLVEVFVTETL